MIGTRVESRRTSWLGIALALLATAACLGLLVATGKTLWLCVAVWPLLVAGSLWLSVPRRFAADISAAGLTLADGTVLEFSQTESVQARELWRERFPILLSCAGRQVFIPARLNVPSRQLFDFLLGMVPARQTLPRDAELASYYQRQREAFGDSLVWHCPGCRRANWPNRFLRARLVCLAFAMAGVVFLVYGGNTRQDAMLGWGGLLTVIGIVGLLFTFATNSVAARNLKHGPTASLILCPLGLALAQGDIKGELRWDEVRNVRLRERGARVTVGSDTGQPRIDLTVDGAVIPIFDIYEQPVPLIHKRIMALWQ